MRGLSKNRNSFISSYDPSLHPPSARPFAVLLGSLEGQTANLVGEVANLPGKAQRRPRISLSSGAKVLWPRTEDVGVADAMIEAFFPYALITPHHCHESLSEPWKSVAACHQSLSAPGATCRSVSSGACGETMCYNFLCRERAPTAPDS